MPTDKALAKISTATSTQGLSLLFSQNLAFPIRMYMNAWVGLQTFLLEGLSGHL
jgi:hypothetical protein